MRLLTFRTEGEYPHEDAGHLGETILEIIRGLGLELGDLRERVHGGRPLLWIGYCQKVG